MYAVSTVCGGCIEGVYSGTWRWGQVGLVWVGVWVCQVYARCMPGVCQVQGSAKCRGTTRQAADVSLSQCPTVQRLKRREPRAHCSDLMPILQHWII